MDGEPRHASRSRSAIFAPLGEPGRAARVEQRLTDAIHAGLLADGERLPSEQELASMLGVATVTAREALVSLRAQGLITTVRGRSGGSFVTSPATDDDDVLRTRLARMSRVELRDRGTHYRLVLAGAVELAAGYADIADIESMRGFLLPADETDPAAWRHAESEIYLSAAALTQSARLTREVIRHEADFGGLLRMPLTSPDFQDVTRAHHQRLISALAAHDGDDARRSMHDHINLAMSHLVETHMSLR